MVSNPQVLAIMDGNRDVKNLISKLAPKETSDMLSFPTPAIDSHQFTNIEIVIHLHTDIGQLLRER